MKAKAKITVKGEYIQITNDGIKRRKNYEEVFFLPELSDDALHQIIKKRPPLQQSILDERLRMKDEQFAAVRTHFAYDLKSLSGREEKASVYEIENLKVEQMSRGQLIAYIEQKGLPVDFENILSVRSLKEHVQDAESDPTAYAKRTKRDREDRAQYQALKDLNEDIGDQQPIQAGEKPKKPPKVAKVAKVAKRKEKASKVDEAARFNDDAEEIAEDEG